mmetsp:Transcript_13704/g.20872  ORF Transcript_13704/g.20872 Transcript_13704/m.20872 type:complete len:214 (+) Transcript_13704:93-734(+)|eukprot:CAMPEP_0178926742 /NCGR_PEP_ID=MMETSP0786-20121207/18724_1 /TAXON_ID=186022 /ORGANISM="Thalassionema frauenfeldii, Strain CCMP 1798" /LENGTH=213 /DNA_ID=CAMNT_0020601943 /DNA_START=73 /DNA_END=714 /DNA_ORIENTATION=+
MRQPSFYVLAYLLFVLLLALPIVVAFHINSTNNHRRLLRQTPPPIHSLHLFGFGEGNPKEGNGDELITIHNVNVGSSIDGLSDYLMKWSKLFESGGMGLTTPVKVSPLLGGDNKGFQILFQATKTGSAYISKKDEQRMEEENGDDGDLEPDTPKKEGGVDIILIPTTDDGVVEIRAQRCEIEKGTIIKEMSEETIVRELNKAIKIWEKQRHKE